MWINIIWSIKLFFVSSIRKRDREICIEFESLFFTCDDSNKVYLIYNSYAWIVKPKKKSYFRIVMFTISEKSFFFLQAIFNFSHLCEIENKNYSHEFQQVY